VLSAYVLGTVPGVGVVAKRPQGWVQCEDHLPYYYRGNSCSLPLLLPPTMSSNNRGDQNISLWWVLSVELAIHNDHVSMANFTTSQSRDPTSLAKKRCY
jgi:hypothetical protein